MSPEIKAGLARIQQETVKPTVNKVVDTKRVAYPRAFGYATNKRISFNGVWRK